MALLFADGFDYYATGDQIEKWDSVVGNTLTASGGRTGGYSQFGTCMKSIAVADGATVIIGYGAKAVASNQDSIARFGYGTADWNGAQLEVKLDTTGAFIVNNGSFTYGGTELGRSAAGVVSQSVWSYVEIKVLFSQTVGTVTIRVNGGEVLALTNKDTCALAHTSISGVIWHCGNHNAVGLDDVYICDGTGSTCNDFLGDIRIVTLLPQTDAVAAGSNAQFTPSTGTDHGALVDEATPDDDTTYLYSSTVNHVDSWEYPALGYAGTIKAVAVNLVARKVEGGTRTIAAVTKPVSTNRVNATNHYLSTSYKNYQGIFEINPEDSLAWDVTDIDGAEFGLKITA